MRRGGLLTSPKLAVCLRVQQKKSVWCLSSLYALSLFIYLSHGAPPTLVLISTASRFVSMSLLEKGGEGRSSGGEESGGRRRMSHQQCLRCGLSEASCCPRPTPALPPLTSGRCSRVRESRSGGGDLCHSRGGGWLCRSPAFSSQGQGPPPSPLLFRTLREETESIVRKNKKVGRYYGDCVAGLLWAELGDRLGLQLPGGAPLGRPPAAPLSRPSEFSSISWMRGGIEPGISIFRVMTRSAPVKKVGERRESVNYQSSYKKYILDKHSFILSFRHNLI